MIPLRTRTLELSGFAYSEHECEQNVRNSIVETLRSNLWFGYIDRVRLTIFTCLSPRTVVFWLESAENGSANSGEAIMCYLQFNSALIMDYHFLLIRWIIDFTARHDHTCPWCSRRFELYFAQSICTFYTAFQVWIAIFETNHYSHYTFTYRETEGDVVLHDSPYLYGPT